MSEPEPPTGSDLAPGLPHFGKRFEYHGPSGVLIFRIEMQRFAEGGLVIIGGTCIEGTESYETGKVKDMAGELITVWVSESDYMRLTNRRVA